LQFVRETGELRRVRDLPRRAPEPPPGLADELTALLRTPTGTMCLRPLQALALYEIGMCLGAFLQLDVGEGKTLISALAPYVLDAKRTLLLLPGALVDKTSKDFAELSKHWLVPPIRIMSYQMLGLVQAAHDLEQFAPDLIVADECHKLKNPHAAVTRRVDRFMAGHPRTMFVPMTGTPMRKSLRDCAHLIRWALKDNAPVPNTDAETDEWALALDEKIENEFARLDPGALMCFADPNESPRIVAARRGFRRRLRETPGVISSAESGTEVGVPIRIRALRYDLSGETAEHFRVLREDMVTPDGWQLAEAVDVWRHAKELALGFHQAWDPRPPEPWRAARRNWHAFVRNVLSKSRTYDSPEHVAQACDAGKLPNAALEAWRAVEHTYEINVVAHWHDDGALRAAEAWMRQGPGIVWTEHVEFARKLAERTGAKYYGAKGFSDDGEFVDNSPAGAALIVSVDANREGRNLQRKWCRSLIVSPEEGPDKLHQLIGRTHRPGQTAPEVTVDVFLGCAEHARAWEKARAGAVSIRDTVGSESKLLLAHVEWPTDVEIRSWSGPRWEREQD
jgi:hypothetical protein